MFSPCTCGTPWWFTSRLDCCSGAGVESVGWLTRHPALRKAGLALLTGGVLLALPAIATGLIAFNRVDHSDTSHALMQLHRNLMLASVGLFSVAVVWRWRAGARGLAGGGQAVAYATLLALASTLLVVGSDRGAALVYAHATGISSERLDEILHEREGNHGHPRMGEREPKPDSLGSHQFLAVPKNVASGDVPPARRTPAPRAADRDTAPEARRDGEDEDARPHEH
jgi:uncharacterized membrane protein